MVEIGFGDLTGIDSSALGGGKSQRTPDCTIVQPWVVEVSARVRIPAKYRVCWGPLQTRKVTRQMPLYTVQLVSRHRSSKPKYDLNLRPEFPIRDMGRPFCRKLEIWTRRYMQNWRCSPPNVRQYMTNT